ncbi:glycosyltransferase family 4 protein [Aquimarina sp. AD1]|uniref:glycosyltransferase family 4 protein n=1 Tax=Aquimarina sp. (strain AD1) TaxID=1714848 RepID=UPI001F379094|nr:glycosyltransferase family 4 protein [Aquimarina sp. AD1]
MKNKGKIIRVTTVPRSLGGLLQGQLKFMSQYYEVIGVSSKDENILDRVAKQEGIEVIPIEMTRKITPIQDLKAVYKLYKVFRKEKPDIVHSHTPKAGTLSMLAARLAGVKHRLHTIAGLPLLEATGSKRLLLDTVEKMTYACATMIYPNSFGLNDIILENKYTGAKKLKVIGEGSSNGIDTAHFDPSKYTDQDNAKLRKELGIDDKDFVFVFVGRFVKDKGINELITSFMKLNTENKQTKLLLVGTYERDLDPLLPETENEIDNNPNIISVGWQNDVRPFFSISDALAFPSYREGFPNVVMQAGSMGLPSIVTNINGCNEIVSEGVNGTIIPVKSSEALYGSMKKFASDKKYADELSLKARDMICQRYERKHVWNAILEEYRQL